ncbi:uncharacterized protein K489DRAFT_97797 [Dissoconium aciculare CBS 342.82]|uniref:Uncharacterized protein n=1 Tax=Dissoconium aciculare CBS 342.82 TaxID=1314786 RepID=A0A6J3MDS3_9PEZI|nr:uncharacterized protein K489DRAFT_97797 [Dissoconium aciculare CBS 342.82]KAF1825754.1 hypothetical protein K489DRAFT_97797 [Dissoconium aciculare CBS 342.82]
MLCLPSRLSISYLHREQCLRDELFAAAVIYIPLASSSDRQLGMRNTTCPRVNHRSPPLKGEQYPRTDDCSLFLSSETEYTIT